MPGVLMIEALAQVAIILLTGAAPDGSSPRAYLRGVDKAKFRLPVVPGDRLRLEVTMGPRRARLARAHAVASIGDEIVAEAELLLALVGSRSSGRAGVTLDPTAIVRPVPRRGGGAGRSSVRTPSAASRSSSAATAESAPHRSSTG